MQERRFDKWQCEAIELSGGQHLVLAPPGCGKTDILTERIVHAHAEGVEYNDMLCLTFTNRAAKGMAQRIADRTGNPVPDGLFVGNIHRYCSQLLFNEGFPAFCTLDAPADQFRPFFSLRSQPDLMILTESTIELWF